MPLNWTRQLKLLYYLIKENRAQRVPSGKHECVPDCMESQTVHGSCSFKPQIGRRIDDVNWENVIFFTIKWFEVKGSAKEMKSELKMWIFVQINQLVCQKSLWRKFEYKIDHHGRLLRPPRQNKVRQIVFNPRVKLFPQKRTTVQCVHFSSILSRAIFKWKKQNSWKTRWGSDDRSPANQIKNVYKNRNGVYPSWHSPHYGQRNHGAFPCLTPRPLS